MSFDIGQVVRWHGRPATVSGYTTGGRVVMVPGTVAEAWRIAEWRERGPWISTGAFSVDETELERDNGN